METHGCYTLTPVDLTSLTNFIITQNKIVPMDIQMSTLGNGYIIMNKENQNGVARDHAPLPDAFDRTGKFFNSDSESYTKNAAPKMIHGVKYC
jgi:hypothetical protein